MNLPAMFLLASMFLPSLASAQTPPKSTPAKPATTATTQKLPPFSGTWLLNLKRSKIETDRPSGTSRAVIQYDGKTWHYIHIHWNNNYEQQEDQWQVTMTVGSPAFHVEREEPLTFRSRIYRQGDAMVLLEYIKTDKGQRTTTTVHYTLEDDGNTLIEEEKSKGPLGSTTNRWVLERQTAQNISIHGAPDNN